MIKFRVNNYRQDLLQIINLFDLPDIEGDWETIQNLFRLDSYRFYTVTVGSKIVGHCSVALEDQTWEKGTPAILESLYLVPERRGKGIGKKFLQFILDDIRGEIESGLILYVKANNTNAIKLYQAFGFKIDYTIFHKVVFGDSLHVMKYEEQITKTLSESKQ